MPFKPKTKKPGSRVCSATLRGRNRGPNGYFSPNLLYARPDTAAQMGYEGRMIQSERIPYLLQDHVGIISGADHPLSKVHMRGGG